MIQIQRLLRSSADLKLFVWLYSGAIILGAAAAQVSYGWVVLVLLAVTGGYLGSRQPTLPEIRFLIVAGLLGIGMSGYSHYRLPQLTAQDMANYAPLKQAKVRVEIVDELKITRTHALSVIALASELLAPSATQVTGQVYVRIAPELWQPIADKIYPGVELELIGSLREPPQARNPGQFDFKNYLAQHGVFSSFYVEQVTIRTQPQNWLVDLRRKIVAAHVQTLGETKGKLLASLVIGSNAVALDPELKDKFSRVGLAHLLTASGMQVSLIIGTCLGFLRKQSAYWQAGITGSILLLYLLLTGGSPSIIRAGFMGYFALAGLIYTNIKNTQLAEEPITGLAEGAIQPLETLSVAAAVLLLWNPLWINDVGFQLSFLATAGLMISATPIADYLPFLPSPIASSIGVSVAAALWTLPLQLQTFGYLSTYALPVNFGIAIVIDLVTILGFISSLLCLVWLQFTVLLNIPLSFCLELLIQLVNFFWSLPGSVFYPGALTGLQVVILYMLLSLFHIPTTLPAQSWTLSGCGAVILFAPSLLPLRPAVQFTIFDVRAPAQAAILETENQVIVFSNLEEKATNYTLMPYLLERGQTQVNEIIPLDKLDPKGLALLAGKKSLSNSSGITLKHPTTTLTTQTVLRLANQTFVRVLSLEPQALIIETQAGRVLYLGKSSAVQQRDLLDHYPLEFNKINWIWTSNKFLTNAWFTLPELQGVLATNFFFSERTYQELATQNKLKLYWTKQHGALIWHGKNQVEPML